MRKLNNEEVDFRLIGRNIKRLDDINGSLKKIHWQCEIQNCNHIWLATSSDILNHKTGCPKCVGLVKLTNEEVDLILISRNIKRLDNITNGNNKTKRKWECLIENCKYIWVSTLCNIVNNKSGCIQCAKQVELTNEIVDQRLKDNIRSIKRIGDIIDTRTKIDWECLICLYIWFAAPQDVLGNKKTGCPKCANRIKLTNKDVDLKLLIENINIKRMGDYITAKIKIPWQCLICQYIWLAAPRSIFNEKTGCPNCSRHKNEKLIGAIFEELNINFERQKYIKDFNKLETKKYKPDFYLKDFNTFIEYNGIQHYKPISFGKNQKNTEAEFIKRQYRDKYVENFCISNNINIIWIDGRKYKGEKLKKYINELIVKLQVRKLNE